MALRNKDPTLGKSRGPSPFKGAHKPQRWIQLDFRRPAEPPSLEGVGYDGLSRYDRPGDLRRVHRIRL